MATTLNKEFERTRRGKNKCPKCKKPKEMYYPPWCPRCEPPKPERVVTLNMIQALRHLEETGHKGIYDKLWDGYLFEDIPGNDRYARVHFPDKDDEYARSAPPELDILYDFVKKKTGEDPNRVLFFYSW